MQKKQDTNIEEISRIQNESTQQISNIIKSIQTICKTSEEFDYLSSFPIFHTHCENIGKILIDKLNIMCSFHGAKLKLHSNILECDMEEKVQEFNADILEKVSVKFYQIKKNYRNLKKTIPDDTPIEDTSKSRSMKRNHSWKKFQSSSNVEKVKMDVDNSTNEFVHKIKIKPHFIEPLHVWQQEVSFKKIGPFRSPFKVEIKNLNFDTLRTFPLVESHSNGKIDKNIESTLSKTPFLFVDTLHQLEIMVIEIETNKNRVISIDLEHHSFRSYLGFTCLIQISTFDKDYVIDSIKLRQNLTILNNFTTNPNILKIFHGCSSDILWLQKDFGVFIVNNVDTCIMASSLGYSQVSYGNLMNLCFNITIDKNLQLADWRLRPLPEIYLSYARLDTHYLLYLYEHLRIDCLKIGPKLCKNVLSQSRTLALEMFRKNDSCQNFHLKFPKIQNVLYYVIKWRDEVARELDESIYYILNNNKCIRIATHYYSQKMNPTHQCPHIDKKYPLKLVKYLDDLEKNKFVLNGLDQQKPMSHKSHFSIIRDTVNCKRVGPVGFRNLTDASQDLQYFVKIKKL
ncbi:hypothetical protein A3Q56_06136 [Intoshia linei]|uniref:3'-5' exonuclease domain-containing protein n=1 Tax=Intoshia linei TaxID=1819745 RepID=A0A177AVY3_9BILA|nr:hypothetical protein A3Q56_06136 [Intoshia linei]